MESRETKYERWLFNIAYDPKRKEANKKLLEAIHEKTAPILY